MRSLKSRMPGARRNPSASKVKRPIASRWRRLLRSAWRGKLRPRVAAAAWFLMPGLMEWRLRHKVILLPAVVKPYATGDPLLLAADAQSLEYRPLLSVLMPVRDAEPLRLNRAVESLLAQAYTDWELVVCDDSSTRGKTRDALRKIALLDPRIRLHSLDTTGGSSAATNRALGSAAGEFVALLDHSDELLPEALLEVAKTLSADRTLDVIYADQAYIDPNGNVVSTFYKPDWSPELLRGVMYVGQLLVVRRSLAVGVGGLDPALDEIRDFEFLLRLTGKTDRVAHISKILYERRLTPGRVSPLDDGAADPDPLQAAAVNADLARRGREATAQANPQHPRRLQIVPKPRLQYPLISIVLRASGADTCLEATCEHILVSSAHIGRELIVAGGDPSAAQKQRLQSLGILLVGPGESDGVAALAGTQSAKGELMVFMAGDLNIKTPDWLDHLLFLCELPGVACVTPLILSPDQKVSSAGLILDETSIVRPAMRGGRPESDGCAGSLSCTHEVSAVPGDCYAITRRVLEDLGGLSAHLASCHYQAVDLSLRARVAGLSNLYTPRVVMIHPELTPAMDGQDELDDLLIADAWGSLARAGDPFCSRNLRPAAGESQA